MIKYLTLNNYLTVIFVLTLSILQAQQFTAKLNYKVKVSKEFSLTNKNKNTDTEALKNFMISMEDGIKNNISKLAYSLKFTNNEALYKLKPSIDADDGFGIKMAKVTTGAHTNYYYNTAENQKIRQTEAYGQRFLISSKLNTRKWQLTQDTKIIGGYLCYKATSTLVTKNNVGTFYKPIVAWYSPKLPVPYGPKGYGGLPGLILQLTEGDFTFYVSKLTLNPKNGVKIKKSTKGKKVTQAEFEKIGESSKLNFVKMRN